VYVNYVIKNTTNLIMIQ